MRISGVLQHQITMATAEQQPARGLRIPKVRIVISGFIATIQVILLATHWFVYQTWVFLRPDASSVGLRIATLFLSFSFVVASLLAYRYWNVWVRVFYALNAVWLGFLNFFFLAACLSWIVYLATSLLGLPVPRAGIADAACGFAILVALGGLVNARRTRVKRVSVQLPNLPRTWRGRVAALVTDVHLGHVNGAGFMRRIIGQLKSLRPDVVFISGDLYDGTHVDVDELAAPWKDFSPPLGSYFVTGNHEEFSDRNIYLRAVAAAGVHVLNNEKIILDGLQLVGIHDSDGANRERFQSILESAAIDRSRASILLTHAPRALAIPEQAGISLQLSGHTHGGQIFPFTWFTHRIFREFTYGLHRFKEMLVYTSYGAGTWGPPMRVGTQPEIVLIAFE
jgi:uncharacterized protein